MSGGVGTGQKYVGFTTLASSRSSSLLPISSYDDLNKVFAPEQQDEREKRGKRKAGVKSESGSRKRATVVEDRVPTPPIAARRTARTSTDNDQSHNGSKDAATDDKIISTCYGVAVTKTDMDCTERRKMMNDTIYTIFTEYLKQKKFSDKSRSKEQMKEELGYKMNLNDLIFFDTFFYPTLMQVDQDKNLLPIDVRYQVVKGRTKNVDIFEKKAIVIPIHDKARNHWVMVLVVNPSALLTPTPTDWSPVLSLRLDDDDTSKCRKKYSRVICMSTVQLQRYLCKEALARKELDLSLEEKDFPLINVEIHQQPNGFDCGYFILHYVELVVTKLDSVLRLLKGDKPSLLSIDNNAGKMVDTIKNLRSKIKNMIELRMPKLQALPPDNEDKDNNDKEEYNNKNKKDQDEEEDDKEDDRDYEEQPKSKKRRQPAKAAGVKKVAKGKAPTKPKGSARPDKRPRSRKPKPSKREKAPTPAN
ncbi:hypothetical protein HDU76_001052, partial [Blyttiomyces sp. JEL0837]